MLRDFLTSFECLRLFLEYMPMQSITKTFQSLGRCSKFKRHCSPLAESTHLRAQPHMEEEAECWTTPAPTLQQNLIGRSGGCGSILAIPATKQNKFRRFQCSSSDRPLTELSPEQTLSLLWIRARSRLFGSCRRLRPIPGHTPSV